jgi:hypothetical protein
LELRGKGFVGIIEVFGQRFPSPQATDGSAKENLPRDSPKRRPPWVKTPSSRGRITRTTPGKAAQKYQLDARTVTPPHSLKTEWGCIFGAILHHVGSLKALGKRCDHGKGKLLPVNLAY